ncbi:non-ribosomal peptide synthetase [Photobacterium sp. CAU 1568]|uniref:Non-ribosomal peptide synthetase n=1 Tax=Photobacterium arenosum TaxID=2774143 RepID=A0ABR9BRL9_9GAMM|nr:non-ribosomal peptide synthetase [Photobacterium arenosum]MBD8515204.1 non-ribosomal peptide synthetase [Photobacterium arenosum]
MFVKLMTHVASGMGYILGKDAPVAAYAFNNGDDQQGINFSVASHATKVFESFSDESVKAAYAANNKTMLMAITSPQQVPPSEVDFFIGYEMNKPLEGIKEHSLLPRQGQHKITAYFRQQLHSLELNISFDTRLVHGSQVTELLKCLRSSLSIAEVAEQVAILNGEFLDEVFATETLSSQLQFAFERYSNCQALVSRNDVITYEQLNCDSSQLCRYIRQNQLSQTDVLAIEASTKRNTVTAILSALKLGKPFVIIETDDINKRRKHILSNFNTPLIINDALIDAAYENAEKPYQLEPFFPASPDDIVCYTFTSGTTGKPKGIAIKSISLLNNILNRHKEICISPKDTVLHNISFTFDPSLWQLFGALSFGARLVLQETSEVLDASLTFQLITGYQVTITDFVPSVLLKLVENQPENVRLDTLRVLYVGGEVFTPSLLKTIREICDARVFNQYGPSECTIDSLSSEIKVSNGSINIGTPIANSFMMIVDDNDQPVKTGDVGELVIGGINLCDGYLDASLNATAFFDYNGDRYYRSGDYCLVNADQQVEFIGRKDRQVKINGIRVELEELESRVTLLECVDSAFAVIHDDALSIYVKFAQSNPDNDAIQLVRESLPRNISTAKINTLSQVPLTTSGKPNLSRLDEFVLADTATEEQQSVAVSDELVQRIMSLFCRVLKINAVHEHDNFFALGGSSLQIIDLLLAIKSSEGAEVNVPDFIHTPTPTHLARLLASPKKSSTALESLPKRLSMSNEMRLLEKEYSLDSRLHRLFFSVTCCNSEFESFKERLTNLVQQTSIFRYSLSDETDSIHLVYTSELSNLSVKGQNFVDEANDLLDNKWRNGHAIPLFSLITSETEDSLFHFYIHRGIFDGYTARIFSDFIADKSPIISNDYVKYIQESTDPGRVIGYRESARSIIFDFQNILENKQRDSGLKTLNETSFDSSLQQTLVTIWEHWQTEKPEEPLYVGVLTNNRIDTQEMSSIGRYVNIVPLIITQDSDIDQVSKYISSWTTPFYYYQEELDNITKKEIIFDILINQDISGFDSQHQVISYSQPQNLNHLSNEVVCIK